MHELHRRFTVHPVLVAPPRDSSRTASSDHRSPINVRSSQTTKADIIEHNLLVAAELEGTTVPAPYAQAVIRAFRRRDISRERTLGLLWGTFSDDDLPDLPQSAEGEIWKFVT